MGQAKRRKAEIETLKKLPPPSADVVHEAGHAVARYMTRDAMGCSAREAVIYIEMHDPTTQGEWVSSDGRALLSSRGVTAGSFFSKDMHRAERAAVERYRLRFGDDITPECEEALWREIIASARADGADIDAWLRASAIGAVSGGMAEAKIRAESFDSVFFSYSCDADRNALIDCFVAAETGGGRQWEILDDAIQYSRQMFETPKIWQATRILASRLLQVERMVGGDVADILGPRIG